MPQVGFICPDKGLTTFEECFKKCRLGERCVSMPVLFMLSNQRIWTGLPSTTQLLNGTRQALLKITKNYHEDIQKMAWVILGNKGHKSLEDADTGGTSEIAFKNKVQSGIADYYESSTRTLWDRKVSGAFKVHKALGMVKKKIIDPSGAKYKRSGNGFKAGDPKKIDYWYMDPKTADKWDWTLQTNRYSIWLDDTNRPVERIKIEVIVRDGGLKNAAMYGIYRNIIIIDIPILNREYVLDYYNRKAKMLRTSLALSWAPKCSKEECWDGRKCEGYCPVRDHCEEMTDNHPAKERFESMRPEILC